MSDREWVAFHPAGTSPSGKTKVWRASGSGGEDDTIGWVKWSGAWRQYVFFTGAESHITFAASCMRQIARFCDEQTTAQRLPQPRKGE